MNRRTHLKLKQLGMIICVWLIVGLFISIYDHLVLLTSNSRGLSAEYTFSLSMIFNLGAALMGALLGGSFLVFFVNVRYQDKPYGYTVLAVAISYILIFSLIIKAGIHCGKVVAGEVGIIKRDITYSGDVLNTTSRILSMCKEFNAELIASSELLTGLKLADNYTAQPLGFIKLRGKEKEALLSAIKPLAIRLPP